MPHPWGRECWGRAGGLLAFSTGLGAELTSSMHAHSCEHDGLPATHDGLPAICAGLLVLQLMVNSRLPLLAQLNHCSSVRGFSALGSESCFIKSILNGLDARNHLSGSCKTNSNERGTTHLLIRSCVCCIILRQEKSAYMV